MENQNTNTEVKDTVSKAIGISEERNLQLVDIIIAAIEQLGKTEEVNHSNAIIACEKALPADITRTEMLYARHMIQYKAEQFARLQQLEKMRDNFEAMLKMMIERLKELDKDENDEDEEESVDPSAN
jgi:isoaspartyl peptidase/L-asparaginase-like protein (Ntn-hydrolase superfamily)